MDSEQRKRGDVIPAMGAIIALGASWRAFVEVNGEL